ncbi:MAG: RT0821/Lpp0805 family surface protein [Gammaproteobacteria bacterium]
MRLRRRLLSTKTPFLALSSGALLSLSSACSHAPPTASAPLAQPSVGVLNQMSDQDVKLANLHVQRALETLVSGQSLSWRSKTGNHAGTVTPHRTYKAKSGFYCRVYAETITIDGVTEQVDGTACRNQRGRWEPI